MERKKRLPTHVRMFNDRNQFDQFLESQRMGYGSGTGAKGKIATNGSIEVVIDADFFRSGGIRDDQLPAIVEHERTELTTKSTDSHLAATIAEYRYILNHFGRQELIQYHTNLCNLYGGTNDIRNKALKAVVGR